MPLPSISSPEIDNAPDSGSPLRQEPEAPYNNETQALMRLKFQKRSALKFVSRIIPRAKLRGTSLQVESMTFAENE